MSAWMPAWIGIIMTFFLHAHDMQVSLFILHTQMYNSMLLQLQMYILETNNIIDTE